MSGTSTVAFDWQGSALGPVSYVVTAADLHPVNACNRILKFANDTYLVIPGGNAVTCQEEIENLQKWATANNLRFNRDKMKEIVFSACHKHELLLPPLPHPDIERVTSLRVLGVIVNNRLTAADHVATLLSSCSRMMYAMRVLRADGHIATGCIPCCCRLSHRVHGACVVWHVLCCRPHTSRLAPATQQAAGLLPDRSAGRRGHVQCSG